MIQERAVAAFGKVYVVGIMMSECRWLLSCRKVICPRLVRVG